MANLKELAVSLLASVDSIDLNGAIDAETELYTVPQGQTCIVTHFVVRSLTSGVSTVVVTFGKAGGACDELLGNQSLSLSAGQYAVLPVDTGLAIQAGEKVAVEITTPEGSAAECSIDVFGYLWA